MEDDIEIVTFIAYAGTFVSFICGLAVLGILMFREQIIDIVSTPIVSILFLIVGLLTALFNGMVVGGQTYDYLVGKE